MNKIARSRFALPACAALAVLSIGYISFAVYEQVRDDTIEKRILIHTDPKPLEGLYIPDIPTDREDTEGQDAFADLPEWETFTAREEIALPEAAPEQEATKAETEKFSESETTQKPVQKPTQAESQAESQATKPQATKPTGTTAQKPQQSTGQVTEQATKPTEVNAWSVTYTQAKGMVKADAAYDYEDLYWLARIISAEAKGESFTGQLGVGTVVLNRVRSREFPNTIKGVVFDQKYGTQFTPVANGTIYQAPTQSAIVAAKMCLDGYTLSGSVLYFLNPSIATSSWIQNNRKYAFRVGNHEFYH